MIELDFDKMDGLVPVIIQDYKSLEILMLGFMNEEAWHKTLETGKVHFYSRTRKKLWMKGESSGNVQIFKKAGFTILNGDRSYFPIIDDDEIECMLIRAQEIPKYVEEEVLDVGLTGKDWIVESGAKVIEIDELVYSKQGMRPVKLVIAVPKDSKIKSIKDLEGKRIATELVGITKNYLKEKRVNADVEFSWGATEAKTPKLADAIVELTETGRSLSANNLRILEVIMESTIRVIVNKKSFDDKRKQQKIRDMVVLLKGALMAEGKVGLKLNIREEKLDEVIEIL